MVWPHRDSNPRSTRIRGEHAHDYTTDESLWWAFLVCFSANTYIVQGRIQDFKLDGGGGGANFKKLRRAEGAKDWLLRNQDNVSEWSDMYIRGLLFPLANTIKKN